MKRAQEAGAAGEARDARDGRNSERPWVPTPMPDPGLARGLRRRRAAGVALLVIAAAGAASLWLGRAGRENAAAQRARAFPTPAASSPEGAGALPVAAVEVPTPPHARTERDETAAPETRARADSGPPAARPTRRARPPADKSYAGSVTVAGGARIELGGIVWSETEPRALLNDQVLGIGGYVEGYMVAKIDTDRVALQKDGETIFLKVK